MLSIQQSTMYTKYLITMFSTKSKCTKKCCLQQNIKLQTFKMDLKNKQFKQNNGWMETDFTIGRA